MLTICTACIIRVICMCNICMYVCIIHVLLIAMMYKTWSSRWAYCWWKCKIWPTSPLLCSIVSSSLPICKTGLFSSSSSSMSPSPILPACREISRMDVMCNSNGQAKELEGEVMVKLMPPCIHASAHADALFARKDAILPFAPKDAILPFAPKVVRKNAKNEVFANHG